MRKQGNYFLPFNEVFTDVDAIKSPTLTLIEKSRGESVFIPSAPIIFPIALAEKIPLKRDYWDEPTTELSKIERVNNFLKPLENHHFQKLLVIPLKKERGTLLQAAFCFNIKAKEAELSFFMSNNYLSMDKRASFAAIYHFENPFRFELTTGNKVNISGTSTITH